MTHTERIQIERWHNRERLSNREIAFRLNKAPQTIHNELKRGLIQLKYKTKYSAHLAQKAYEDAKKRCGSHRKLTGHLNQRISSGLLNKYSLEVIHQSLSQSVALRTLYNWLHNGWLSISLENLLYPRHKTANKPYKTIPKHKLGKSIEERPTHINDRSEVGHYEIDTVILSKTKGQCLLTLPERKYRTEIIRLLPDKTSKSVNDALLILNKSYRFKSITLDNGKEFARLSEAVSCPVYYCHAYASCERGTNENHNRMIRRFLPKGTKKTTHEVIAFIEDWINNYPRRMFNYKSSIQMSTDG
ncbi:IS30 family transposase [Lactococcus piscium]|uniref:IS30 family transposase n=1 Tax=Pseudolactococcus carnosus TaxID=2749961 RepID=UPI001FBBEFD4|nr:IS30 family transposase [Lactococcus carnosus]MCJ1996945.1 IS30 family transposase [Lactococcus carnosus]